MDSDTPSIMAMDAKASLTVNQTTVNDLRTPLSKQVPDAIQPEDAGISQLEQQEEVDYNWDVAYLQKYGRA